MSGPQPDPARVEVLKVWYSVFCTLIDAHAEQEYTDAELIEKMQKLRTALAEAVPEVEEHLRKSRM